MARVDFNPLPSVSPSGQPSPGFSQRADPDAFGAGVGRAQAGLGAVMAEAGDRLNQHAMAFQELNNETHAKQADIDMQKRLTALGYGDPADKDKPGYFALGGQAAFDGAKPTIEEAEKARDQILEKLPNDGARNMAKRTLDQRILSFSESVASSAAKGRKDWMLGTSTARAEENIKAAANYYNDPAKVEQAIAVAKGEAIQQGEITGASPEMVIAQQRSYESQARVAVIDRMLTDDPLGAQEYYRKHIDTIDGAAHAQVEKALKSAVTPVLTANIWKSTVQGAPAPNRNLVDVVAQAESGGRERNPDGSRVTSPKGAVGIMQVMPETLKNPGFGIAPSNGTPEDDARVGREYLQAMLGRYGNQTVALAAYNWGPGAVDKVLERMGSAPGKSGNIDEQAFLARTPAETRAYVQGINAKAPQQPGRPPATDDVEQMAPAWIATVRQRAEQAFPQNPAAVEQAVNGAESYVAEIKRGQAVETKAARDTVMMATMGLTAAPGGGFVPTPGFVAPTTLEALLATPEARAAWSKLDADAARGVLAQIKQNASGDDPVVNDASMGKYYELTGLAVRDPEAFGQVNLADPKLLSTMPRGLVKELMGMQRSMQTRDAKAAIQGAKIQHALTVSAPILRSSGVYYTVAPSSKGFSQEKSARYDQFVGRLQENLNQYFEANKKNPNDDEIRKMTGALLAEGSERGTGVFWDKKARVFEVADPAKFAPVIPDEVRPAIVTQFTARKGRAPTPNEIEDIYRAYLLGAK